MSTKSKKLLSVVGLGYVGLPLAVEFAKNREVVAFDINADRVKQLKGFNNCSYEIYNTWHSKNFGKRIPRKSLLMKGFIKPGSHLFKVELIL